MIYVVVTHDNYFGDRLLYEIVLHDPPKTSQTIGWVTKNRGLYFITPELPWNYRRVLAEEDRIVTTFQDVEDLKDNLWTVFI